MGLGFLPKRGFSAQKKTVHRLKKTAAKPIGFKIVPRAKKDGSIPQKNTLFGVQGKAL